MPNQEDHVEPGIADCHIGDAVEKDTLMTNVFALLGRSRPVQSLGIRSRITLYLASETFLREVVFQPSCCRSEALKMLSDVGLQ